ncbi:SDR family oxidoreductase [Halococcus sediminicola]|uniref:SDR family oxidoreductase n=1 Tax=Halococcus sediminicola TaxID=1264579 RepID=UPI0006790422|nr:SDR family oxidoreductase [Halococcus sediminicola]
MNVLIAGAHGGVGKHITELLSESDHAATAMVRKESQTGEMADFGVETVVADLTEDVTHAVAGHDAIVFAAGSGGEDVEGVDRDGAIGMIEAAEAEGVDRFVMLSSMNADSPDDSPDALYDYLLAKQAADARLQESDLTYTIVRPGALTDDPATDEIRAARKLDRGEITRANVAHTLVAALDMASTHGETFEILAGDEPIESALENPTQAD